MVALAHGTDGRRSRQRRRARVDQPRRAEHERRDAAIVCGVDGSVYGRAAARLAAALAHRLAGRLVLVHAVTVGVPSYSAWAALEEAPRLADLEARELDAAQQLERELRRELAAPRLTMEVRGGPAAQCILATAEEENADLIVLGCRGVGAVRAAVLGAVTDEMVAHAPCPLVIVPPAVSETGAVPLTGRSVLCGIRGFDDVACAHVAHALARRLGCRLVLAHVLPRSADAAALTPAGVASATLAARGPTREQAALAALRRIYDELSAGDAADLRVHRGNAGRELADLAVREDAMLTVMGARHWRSPLGAALRGSVSRRIARSGRRPLVLCPSPRSG